ncbi:MAG: transglycosylase SLT domain-containing protein [Treponema sp.]|jgi:soluble lytic murein transglycosylase-like protein|nr:transglycosylase SLT domain-containing protein [Treponema sp.]
MNFNDVKMEKVLPLFSGILGSLVLCSLLALHLPFNKPATTEIAAEINREEHQEDTSIFFATEKKPDVIRELYINPAYREWVIEFFAGVCSSREIAQAILENAHTFNVPPALAFALSWEESRFEPRAVNRRNQDGSVDRGLFQLNNRSFPKLDNAMFFSITDNARFGISHLKHCIETGGSEVSALAMYNAGTGRVRTTGAPKVTLDYINRILENRLTIEEKFYSRYLREAEIRLAEAEDDDSSTVTPQLKLGLLVRNPL